MKKISIVVAVVAALAIVQTSAAVARGSDQGDNRSQRRDAAVERSGQDRNNRDRAGERRRDPVVSTRQERQGRFADRVDNRQANQRARIREGRESGALTRGETRKLRKDQKKIVRMERRFERDGHFDKRERRILTKAQDRASKRIYRAKHNDRSRGYPGRWGGRKHHGYNHYRGWQRHGYHDHTHPPVEEQVAYAPSASSSLALDLQFEGFSVGLSKSKQF